LTEESENADLYCFYSSLLRVPRNSPASRPAAAAVLLLRLLVVLLPAAPLRLPRRRRRRKRRRSPTRTWASVYSTKRSSVRENTRSYVFGDLRRRIHEHVELSKAVRCKAPWVQGGVHHEFEHMMDATGKDMPGVYEFLAKIECLISECSSSTSTRIFSLKDCPMTTCWIVAGLRSPVLHQTRVIYRLPKELLVIKSRTL
jgi:hypothetical protein